MTSVFERDAEFIQLLCNPEYIRWLHSQNYFTNAEFIDYLRYLRYYHDYKYLRFLIYPQAVVILEILLEDDILTKLEDESFYTNLAQDQYLMWKHRDR